MLVGIEGLEPSASPAPGAYASLYTRSRRKCRRQESNLHGRPHASKACASANSATPACCYVHYFTFSYQSLEGPQKENIVGATQRGCPVTLTTLARATTLGCPYGECASHRFLTRIWYQTPGPN